MKTLETGNTYIAKNGYSITKIEILEQTVTSIFIHYVDGKTKVRMAREEFNQTFTVIEDLGSSAKTEFPDMNKLFNTVSKEFEKIFKK